MPEISPVSTQVSDFITAGLKPDDWTGALADFAKDQGVRISDVRSDFSYPLESDPPQDYLDFTLSADTPAALEQARAGVQELIWDMNQVASEAFWIAHP